MKNSSMIRLKIRSLLFPYHQTCKQNHTSTSKRRYLCNYTLKPSLYNIIHHNTRGQRHRQLSYQSLSSRQRFDIPICQCLSSLQNLALYFVEHCTNPSIPLSCCNHPSQPSTLHLSLLKGTTIGLLFFSFFVLLPNSAPSVPFCLPAYLLACLPVCLPASFPKVFGN